MTKSAKSGSVKDAETTVFSPTLAYPIPDNGETLRSEHLRQLAMLTVRQGALGAQAGAWGYFVPPGQQAGSCNIVTIGDGKVRVDNLSILTNSGIAIRADHLEAQLRTGIETESLSVTWAMPEHAVSRDRAAPLLVGLSLASLDKADANEVLGRVQHTVGRRSALPQWVATAPLVTLGATPQTAAAAASLDAALESLAAALDASERVPRLTRMLIRSSVLASRSHLLVSPTTTALAAVGEALLASVALMRAVGTDSDEKLAQQFETDILLPPTCEAEPVLCWLEIASNRLTAQGDLLTWLRGAVQSLAPLPGFPISLGGSVREFRYAFPGNASQQLRVNFESDGSLAGSGVLYPIVWVRFGGDRFRQLSLVRSETGFTASVKREGKGGELELRVPAPIEPTVIVDGGA